MALRNQNGDDDVTQLNHGSLMEDSPRSMFERVKLAQRRVWDTFKCCTTSPPTAKANFYTPLVRFQNTQKTGRSITHISQTLADLKRHESVSAMFITAQTETEIRKIEPSIPNKYSFYVKMSSERVDGLILHMTALLQ